MVATTSQRMMVSPTSRSMVNPPTDPTRVTPRTPERLWKERGFCKHRIADCFEGNPLSGERKLPCSSYFSRTRFSARSMAGRASGSVDERDRT